MAEERRGLGGSGVVRTVGADDALEVRRACPGQVSLAQSSDHPSSFLSRPFLDSVLLAATRSAAKARLSKAYFKTCQND